MRSLTSVRQPFALSTCLLVAPSIGGHGAVDQRLAASCLDEFDYGRWWCRDTSA